MPKSQLSWVRYQHPPTQWNLWSGRWNSVEYSTYIKKYENTPLKGTHARELLVFWASSRLIINPENGLNNKIFSNHIFNFSITVWEESDSDVGISDFLIIRKNTDLGWAPIKIVSYFLLSFSCVSTTPEPTTPPPTVPEFKRNGGKKC